MADDKKPENVDTSAPDPDEDDLDDLDDVLDEFAATKLDAKESPPTATTSKPSASGPGRPPASAPKSDAAAPFPSEEEFAKQLQAGMADLLGELESSPEMQRQFEELVRELGDVTGAGPAANLTGEGGGGGAKDGSASAKATGAGEGEGEGSAAAAAAAAAASSKSAEESFQDTIRRTMERISESDQNSSAAAASASTDDILAQMLKEMEKSGFGGAGGDGDEDFSQMLMGMMEQLTNKEILYEPMKELHDKFPAWMEKNRDGLSFEDKGRYDDQMRLTGEIVAKFEESNYSDESASHREYIVERMQKMQAAGSPPPDLVGDMSAAQEALGELDEGCPQQ